MQCMVANPQDRCLRCRLMCVWKRVRGSREPARQGVVWCEVSSDVCIWVRVRRFRGWLSGRVLSEVWSEMCVEVRMIFC